MSVSTDPIKIAALLSRRVTDVAVEESLREKLNSGRQLRIKLGVDPTAPDIHLGHSIPLKKLREFQDLGHQAILLIGDYTARVGDPTGKSKTRPMLTAEEVEANAQTYLEQAGKILDMKKLEIRRNSEWFAPMTFEQVLNLVGQFTVARMIERDDFAKRLAEGTEIHMHELLYPMMQAYDSIALGADVEIGSTDQRFNILAGRELQAKLGKPQQDCLFLGPILVGTDGAKKMSKSLGNYIGVSEAPEEMYGKTMSVTDEAMWDWFLLATDVPEQEIGEMKTACERGEMNPRDAKARLAREIVTEYHSAKAAKASEEHFNRVIRDKEMPDEVPEFAVEPGQYGLIDLLSDSGLAASKSEARRLIEQGGVKVNGEVVKDIGAVVAFTDAGAGYVQAPSGSSVSKQRGEIPVEIIIQKGKHQFIKLVLK